MKDRAEMQLGTQLSAPVAEAGSSLAASVAAESNSATAADAASMTFNNALGQNPVQRIVSESKDAAMGDAERVAQLETNANNESDSSATKEGTSSPDDKIETKRRKLAD
jgi:hypothetical protein